MAGAVVDFESAGVVVDFESAEGGGGGGGCVTGGDPAEGAADPGMG